MKTILFFDHDAKITGSSISMRYIIESFLKNGFQVYLLTRKESKDFYSFQEQGVKIIIYSRSSWKSIALSIHFSDEFLFLSKKWFLTFIKNKIRLVVGIFTCFQVIKKIRPDLIYINEHNMFYCGFIAKLLGIPSFIHIRSKFIRGLFGMTERIISKLILASNDHIFAITRVESEQILKSNRKFAKKVKVIPEFLNENDFLIEELQTGIREKMDLPLDKIIVISFGGFDELKGTDDFLQSIKMVCKRNPNVYFILAGNSEETETKKKNPYKKRIDELLEDVEIQNNLTCVGFTHDAKRIIVASDILVSSLKYSHFSRPILEAWAVRKAIVTSDSEHARSYIKDKMEGIYYKSGDSQGLANAILSLVTDRKLYSHIAENGYNKARQYYLSESNSDQIVKQALE